jgi:hypothetical protein
MSQGWTRPSGLEPFGLLLAIYEDGQVLLINRTSYVPAPPHLSIARIEAGAAKRLAKSYQLQLGGVPEVLYGDSSFSDMGWTDIQVWDSQRQKYRRYSAYGHPCLPPGAPEPQEVPEMPITSPDDIDKIDWGASFTNWTFRNRKGTDPRFIKACDSLLGFSVPDAKPWVPKEFWVEVWMSQEEPRLVQSWPGDWPPMPVPVAKGNAELCFHLSEPASETTVKMRSDSGDDRDQAADTGFPADASHWWNVSQWGYALPGEIGLVTDNNSSLELARGPCKTY